MSGVLGSAMVVVILLAVVALAIRSVWREHKSGGCCGDCAHCSSCHGK